VVPRIALGFGRSVFRYAGPAGQEWTLADLAGKRLATAYPRLVRENLKKHDVDAEVIQLDGAVEISIQLGVADAIADLIETGRTLREHGLAPFGEPICVSEAVLVQREGAPETPEKDLLANWLQGIVFAQQYMMLDYDCPKSLLDDATQIAPGLRSPTVAPLADAQWVAVRVMVPRAETHAIMDRLAQLGAQAILASDIRSCRM